MVSLTEADESGRPRCWTLEVHKDALDRLVDVRVTATWRGFECNLGGYNNGMVHARVSGSPEQEAKVERGARPTMVEGNRDTLAGFVLNVADVAQVKSPCELYEAHGLGFPGSLWDPAAGYLDVLLKIIAGLQGSTVVPEVRVGGGSPSKRGDVEDRPRW